LILTRRQLAEMEEKHGLVSEYIDIETQLQPHGLDITVREVHRLQGAGRVDFNNSGRRIPESSPLAWSGEWLHLDGGAYKVLFNEVLNIPTNMAALGRPRSSLLRCGVSLHTAVWDAGYRGRSEALLHVLNPAGFDLKRNARILQLVFFRLDERGDAYDGDYLGENI